MSHPHWKINIPQYRSSHFVIKNSYEPHDGFPAWMRATARPSDAIPLSGLDASVRREKAFQDSCSRRCPPKYFPFYWFQGVPLVFSMGS